MNELERIKQRKLAELQRAQSQNQVSANEEEQKIQDQLQQIESVVKRTFTREALERYGNLKSAHPQKAMQLIVVLGQAIQSGQTSQIDDAKLREILVRMEPKKKDFTITRK